MELRQCFWMCEKLDQDENFTTSGFWKYIYWMWCTHQNFCGKGVTLLSPHEQLHDSEWDGNLHSGLLGWHHAIFQVGTKEQNTPSISLRMKTVLFPNEGTHLKDCKVSEPTTSQHESSWPWKPQILEKRVWLYYKMEMMDEEAFIAYYEEWYWLGWHFKSVIHLEMLCYRTIA